MDHRQSASSQIPKHGAPIELAGISRRAALRLWLAGASSLTLLAAAGALTADALLAAPADQSGGPAPAQIPAATPTAGPSTAIPSMSSSTTSTVSAMCVMKPEQTEGPYYIDTQLLRSDITEGKDGVPLRLNLTVLDASSCQPLPQATVEIWHCDAAGDYSGFSASPPDAQSAPPGSSGGPGGPGGPPPGDPPPSGGPDGPGGGSPPSGPGNHNTPTNDMVFLRGGQVTDMAGTVTFQTIYPGWYRGRTVHIHIKVHVAGQEVHTSQLYFDDDLSDRIFRQSPYDTHQGRDTRNATDSIFANGGQEGLLTMTPAGSGYIGALTLGVQL